jgi:sugar phosphate isomerase/epimerase
MTAPLALQLYTVREQLARDFDGTLARVAEIGYAAVETAFFEPEITPARARRALDALGLPICAIHCELPLGDQQQAVIDMAGQLGCTRLVWHGWPRDARYGTLGGVEQLAETYSRAAEVAASAGLELGIHNHWWEFELVEGRRPYQLLRERMDPRIFFELDTYWATVAGCNAVAVVEELGARAPLLHIKDGPAVPGAPKTAVGAGVMDVPAIVAASRGNAEWLIVELDDCATDMLEAVAQSYRYMVDNGLAHGRR